MKIKFDWISKKFYNDECDETLRGRGEAIASPRRLYGENGKMVECKFQPVYPFGFSN